MQVKRRNFLTGAGVAAVAAAAAVMVKDDAPAESSQDAQFVAQTDKPNILLLCIDDLRDWVGYMNSHPGVYTPNIDRLRAQSYSYDRAYCAVPVCISSRASTLWGLTPETAQLDGLDDEDPYWALQKSRHLQPLPIWLSRGGYKTISTGKVFDAQIGSRRFWDVFQPYTDIPIVWGTKGSLFDYGLMPEGEIHADQVSANFAMQQIGEEHDKPWFMSIGLFQPHVPWRLPQWAFDLHPIEKVALPEVRARDLDDVPRLGVELVQHPDRVIDGVQFSEHDLIVEGGLWTEHVQAYLAACSHTDAMIGQILDALDASPYADNTAVVLWSDHGYHLGEKLHWRKMTLWEQATRIPLLVRAPWRVKPGGAFDDPVSLVDLGPTLTDLAGIETPGQFEGKSLIGITEEEAARRPAQMRWGSAVSTRKGNWRWTRYEDGGQELYNLADDPREYNNLLGKDGALEGGLDSLS